MKPDRDLEEIYQRKAEEARAQLLAEQEEAERAAAEAEMSSADVETEPGIGVENDGEEEAEETVPGSGFREPPRFDGEMEAEDTAGRGREGEAAPPVASGPFEPLEPLEEDTDPGIDLRGDPGTPRPGESEDASAETAAETTLPETAAGAEDGPEEDREREAGTVSPEAESAADDAGEEETSPLRRRRRERHGIDLGDGEREWGREPPGGW